MCKFNKFFCFFCFFLAFTNSCFSYDPNLIEELKRSKVLNMKEVVTKQNLRPSGLAKGWYFKTENPYYPQHKRFFGQKSVAKWFKDPGKQTSVCALQVVDLEKRTYILKTMRSKKEAEEQGLIVTHQNRCGTCSSLKDLAVYMEKPDLTTPARRCSKKITLGQIKRCMEKEIGFSSRCAESWAYNAHHTRNRCVRTCVSFYGLWNVITDNMPHNNADEEGNLNPCLKCDEEKSGPGFQFSAGRTRRNSGLESAIVRRIQEIYSADHSRYFK